MSFIRAYYEPVFLGKTVLILPMFWASHQASIKVWNFFYPYMNAKVYEWLYPVMDVIATYFGTLGFVEIGIKVGLIIAYNRNLQRIRSEQNAKNTVYVKKS